MRVQSYELFFKYIIDVHPLILLLTYFCNSVLPSFSPSIVHLDVNKYGADGAGIRQKKRYGRLCEAFPIPLISNV